MNLPSCPGVAGRRFFYSRAICIVVIMSNKLKKKKSVGGHSRQDSVFKEAWENMNNDFSRFMPGFLTRHSPRGKGKIWVVVVVTLAELLVLGAVGKIIYDWIMK